MPSRDDPIFNEPARISSAVMAKGAPETAPGDEEGEAEEAAASESGGDPKWGRRGAWA
jgi:hypothetical protein